MPMTEKQVEQFREAIQSGSSLNSQQKRFHISYAKARKLADDIRSFTATKALGPHVDLSIPEHVVEVMAEAAVQGVLGTFLTQLVPEEEKPVTEQVAYQIESTLRAWSLVQKLKR